MKSTKITRTMRKETILAYWLIPARPERDLFVEFIRILADELDAPRFEPHLSICAAPNADAVRKILGSLASAPITLRVKSVSYSNLFTKTLFVRFERNAALDKLNVAVRRAAKAPEEVLRDPHVSLIYKRMPTGAKRELASTLRLPFKEVVFDSIKVLRALSPMDCAADVDSWRTVAMKKLVG
jgi:hypothetical protein